MTVIYKQPVKVGRKYLVTWSSDLSSPVTYRIWLNGKNMGTTQATSILVSGGDQLDVLDDVAATPEVNFPRACILQWAQTSGGPGSLAHYRVDEWILGVGAWVERLKINHADDQVYYQYTSRELEDDTTHTFRVTPVSAGGIDGIARSFVLLMVRRPDVPRVSYTYNNLTGNVTIAAV